MKRGLSFNVKILWCRNDIFIIIINIFVTCFLFSKDFETFFFFVRNWRMQNGKSHILLLVLIWQLTTRCQLFAYNFFYIQSTSLDKAIFFNETVFFVIIWCTFANYQCKVHKCKLLVLKKYYYGIHFKQLKKQTGKHLFQSFIDSYAIRTLSVHTVQTFIMAFTSITQFLFRLKRTFQYVAQ